MNIVIKAAILFAAAIASANSSENHGENNEIPKITAECISESSVPIADLVSAYKQLMLEKKVSEARSWNCYSACLAVKSGVFSKGKPIDPDKATLWVPEHEREEKRKIVVECSTEKNRQIQDDCDRDYDCISCLLEKNPNIMDSVELIPSSLFNVSLQSVEKVSFT